MSTIKMSLTDKHTMFDIPGFGTILTLRYVKQYALSRIMCYTDYTVYYERRTADGELEEECVDLFKCLQQLGFPKDDIVRILGGVENVELA